MPQQEQCVCVCPEKGRARMKREIRANDREKLAQEIAGLTGLSIKELKDRWRTLYGAEAHQRISRELLTRAIAYRIQELALGGLKPSTRRLLERIAESASSRQPLRAVPVRKTPRGTVLIREWQGVSHRVAQNPLLAPNLFRTETNEGEMGHLPDWSRSPLPRAVRNRPQGAYFDHFRTNCKRRETRWRMTQSGTNPSLP